MVFQMAEVTVPKELFEAILERIDQFRDLSLEAVFARRIKAEYQL